MKHLRVLVVVAVLANIVILALVLLRGESARPGEGLQSLAPLVSDQTMDAARYDLKDRADKLNVILISMDALRYDRTGFGGNKDGLTPNLDAFAEEAVVFHRATSAASWTLPSHMSMWTARWPTVHGITNKLKLMSADQMAETTLSAGIETWPNQLVRRGMVAAGFTGGAGVQGKYGFSRGFETYVDDRPFAGLDYSAPKALEWLRANQGKRFFLFLHGYDSHGQYPLPEGEIKGIAYTGALNGGIVEQAELREKGLEAIENPGDEASLSGVLSPADAAFLEDIYDLKVRDADQRLGSFLAQIRAMGLMDNTVIAVVSDHGDEFMEHGQIDHGQSLYEELTHVVMMVRFPGYARRHDVADIVRTVDLFPTLFDALGIPGPEGADGKSLLPLLRGQPEAGPAFSETDYRLYVHQRMIRDGDWKLILDLQDGQRKLYNLATDPGEKNDVSSAEPRRTYEMEQALRTWMNQVGSNPQDYLGLRQKPIEIF